MSICRALLIGLAWAACSAAPARATPQEADAAWTLDQLMPGGRLAWARVPDGSSLARDLPPALLHHISLPGELGELLNSWREHADEGALQELLGGPSELAVYQTEGQRLSGSAGARQVLLATRPPDCQRARARIDELTAACARAGMPTHEGSYRGVTYRRLGRQLVLAWLGEQLVIASNDELLADAVDGSRDPTRARSASKPPDSVELALALDALHRKDFKGLRMARRRPVGRDALPILQLLLGPLGEQLADSGWALGTLQHSAQALSLELNLPITDGGTRAAASAIDLPMSEFSLAAAVLRVDLGDVWRRREALASQQVQPRLAKLDRSISMLFAGRSLAEDVLSRLRPELALVLGSHAFERDDSIPSLRLPAACLVARLRSRDDSLASLLVVAFQSTLAGVNMQRAEEGHAPFLLSSLPHRGVILHSAQLLAGEGSGDGSPTAPLSADFNLTPCLALVGDRLLLGSSTAQVRRLVDALLDEETRSVRGLAWLALDGASLADELEQARLPLAGRLVLLRGSSADDALSEVDRWVAELRDAGRLEADLTSMPGSLRARLQLQRPGPDADVHDERSGDD
ncbi:MAG: hypothetical protein DRQ55_11400 [Planctomycetota bacterium]|nr:MAG: hypothetical protein DRQ55_11400 [Planctomycetota bacterium]